MNRETARTKRDIVRQIAEELGFPRKMTADIVQRTLDAIVEAIVMDERVEFRNFGVFLVKKRLGRKARNPKTQTEVDVPPRYVVTFRAGKQLEARVRELMLRDHPPARTPSPPPESGPGAKKE